MPHFERSLVWYVVAGIIVSGFFVGAIYLHIWSLAVVLVILSIVYLMVHKTIPVKEIVLREDGYTLEGKLTEWEKCTGFWILLHDGYHELHIGHVQKQKNDTVIHLGDSTPQEVRSVLQPHLK